MTTQLLVAFLAIKHCCWIPMHPILRLLNKTLEECKTWSQRNFIAAVLFTERQVKSFCVYHPKDCCFLTVTVYGMKQHQTSQIFSFIVLTIFLPGLLIGIIMGVRRKRCTTIIIVRISIILVRCHGISSLQTSNTPFTRDRARGRFSCGIIEGRKKAKWASKVTSSKQLLPSVEWLSLLHIAISF